MASIYSDDELYCWVMACKNGVVFNVDFDYHVPPKDSCNAHIGDLLGNYLHLNPDIDPMVFVVRRYGENG